MPDCVLQVPGKLQPFSFKESKYDLIILGYQAWFLSPSIPSNTLLFDAGFRETGKKYTRYYDYRSKKYVAQRHGKNQTGVKDYGCQADGQYGTGGPPSQFCEFCHDLLLDV